MTSTQIELRPTDPNELSIICELESGRAGETIIPYSLARHQKEIAKSDMRYLTILADRRMHGFCILRLEASSVELRRIVVEPPGRGIGTQALQMLDDVCLRTFGRTRIWLDVFESNEKARRLYERCGYARFDRAEHEGRALLLYEKRLSSPT